MYPEATWFRNGGPGDKQEGFDVLSTDPTKPKVQCKRVAKFGPAHVKRAIEDAPSRVRHERPVIALSKIASAGARKKTAEFPNWELWDAEDLEARVLELPLDARVRVVDTFFPGWRKAFLGVSDPSLWLSPEE
jgi:hypothetical protein